MPTNLLIRFSAGELMSNTGAKNLTNPNGSADSNAHQSSLSREDAGVTQKNLAVDLQGAGKLAVDAVTGVTDIAESLHSTIHRLGGLLGKPKTAHRTRGITGLVYNNIRLITNMVGKGVNLPLSYLADVLDESPSSMRREAVLATLNGILGDHLYSQQNPLAISMQLRHNGRALDSAALEQAVKQSGGRLLIMIHGLCMNDLQWTRRQHNHGEAIADDLGMSPLYLHYNSGLHISENGRKLCEYLQRLLEQPGLAEGVRELHILAHSMGGLVARSACYYAEQAGSRWLNSLQKVIFLGTPHHGAWLERGGNWLDTMLAINPYSAPFARIGKIRSSGVTDLRHGYILDDHWQYNDRFELRLDQRTPVPLPADVNCYTVATTCGKAPGDISDHLAGDGLVPLNSALGIHKNTDLNLLFARENSWIGRGIHHFDLLCKGDVYGVIKQWLSAAH